MGLTACGSGDTGASTTTSSSTSATSSGATGEIPDETAGPYPGDGSNGPDVLEQSGIVRSDLRSSFGEFSGTAEGVPMTLELTVTDLGGGGAAFAGAAVYVWHCTREGGYSLYSDGVEPLSWVVPVFRADPTTTPKTGRTVGFLEWFTSRSRPAGCEGDNLGVQRRGGARA